MTAEPTLAPSTRVLFVGNDETTPQCAAGLLRRLAGDWVQVRTASTAPTRPGPAELTGALGPSATAEQRLSSRALHTSDRVVVLGAGLDVARLPGPRYEEWDLAADDLVHRVETLSSELDRVPTTGVRSTLLGWLRTHLSTPWLPGSVHRP